MPGKEFEVNQTSVSCGFIGSGAEDANLLCFDQSNNTGKCEGDSGGPSFAMIDGARTQVGITSFGDPMCKKFGGDTRTDAAKLFIISHVPELQGSCTQDTASAVCGARKTATRTRASASRGRTRRSASARPARRATSARPRSARRAPTGCAAREPASSAAIRAVAAQMASTASTPAAPPARAGPTAAAAAEAAARRPCSWALRSSASAYAVVGAAASSSAVRWSCWAVGSSWRGSVRGVGRFVVAWVGSSWRGSVRRGVGRFVVAWGRSWWRGSVRGGVGRFRRGVGPTRCRAIRRGRRRFVSLPAGDSTRQVCYRSSAWLRTTAAASRGSVRSSLSETNPKISLGRSRRCRACGPADRASTSAETITVARAAPMLVLARPDKRLCATDTDSRACRSHCMALGCAQERQAHSATGRPSTRHTATTAAYLRSPGT